MAGFGKSREKRDGQGQQALDRSRRLWGEQEATMVFLASAFQKGEWVEKKRLLRNPAGQAYGSGRMHVFAYERIFFRSC